MFRSGDSPVLVEYAFYNPGENNSEICTPHVQEILTFGFLEFESNGNGNGGGKSSMLVSTAPAGVYLTMNRTPKEDFL